MTEEKTPRPRDLIWDQMEILFGRTVRGTRAHGKRTKAVKDMKLNGATEDTIRYAYEQYLARFSGAICTDIALATHYPLLVDSQIQPPPRRYGYGVSAGEILQAAKGQNGHGPGSHDRGDARRGLPAGDA